MVPSFGSYEYYFLTDELDVSQFQYSMISLGAAAFIVVAIVVYQFFKDLEVRSLFIIACSINSFTSFISLALARRWNQQIGIPDYVLYWASDACFSQFVFAFTQLPAQVLFTEINPPDIEAFVVAVQGTLFALAQYMVGELSGVLINETFVHVSKEDLSNYWVLQLISTIAALWPILWMWLVPTKKTISLYQEKIDKLNDDAAEEAGNGADENQSDNAETYA